MSRCCFNTFLAFLWWFSAPNSDTLTLVAHCLPQFDLKRILSRFGDGVLILKVLEDYTISLKVYLYFIPVSSHFLNLGWQRASRLLRWGRKDWMAGRAKSWRRVSSRGAGRMPLLDERLGSGSDVIGRRWLMRRQAFNFGEGGSVRRRRRGLGICPPRMLL